METLQNQLRTQAHEMGAWFFGAADLIPAQDFITAQGGEFLGQFPRAISVGISLHDSIVDHKEFLSGHVFC